MKSCPIRRRDYYDDSLIYCLDDGTTLLEGPAGADEHRKKEEKRMNLRPRLARSFIVLLIAAVPLLAQDTLTVNSDSVTLKFENDRVRVLESVLKIGAKENTHSHPRYVTYVIEAGTVRNHRDGTTSDYSFKKGEVLYRDALTHWSENIGRTAERVIMFELKNSDTAGEPYLVQPDKDPVKLSPRYYKVAVDNQYVRVLEYRLKPGQKEVLHSHPCGVVYYLTGAKWRAWSQDGKTTESETRAGEIVWRDPTTHAVENLGKTEARAIAIEMKGPCKAAGKKIVSNSGRPT
jgi:quercetin dioxygenase-like cupin family protein